MKFVFSLFSLSDQILFPNLFLSGNSLVKPFLVIPKIPPNSVRNFLSGIKQGLAGGFVGTNKFVNKV